MNKPHDLTMKRTIALQRNGYYLNDSKVCLTMWVIRHALLGNKAHALSGDKAHALSGSLSAEEPPASHNMHLLRCATHVLFLRWLLRMQSARYGRRANDTPTLQCSIRFCAPSATQEPAAWSRLGDGGAAHANAKK